MECQRTNAKKTSKLKCLTQEKADDCNDTESLIEYTHLKVQHDC